MAIPILAANSYAAAQKLIEAGSISAPSSGAFSDLVKQSIAAFEGHAKHADLQISNAISGNVDYVSAVTAVAETETAVETLVAVRDKVIAAYDDIMRMTV
jgi:flagellar hook-basal body complex protein FliE